MLPYSPNKSNSSPIESIAMSIYLLQKNKKNGMDEKRIPKFASNCNEVHHE